MHGEKETSKTWSSGKYNNSIGFYRGITAEFLASTEHHQHELDICASQGGGHQPVVPGVSELQGPLQNN